MRRVHACQCRPACTLAHPPAWLPASTSFLPMQVGADVAWHSADLPLGGQHSRGGEGAAGGRLQDSSSPCPAACASLSCQRHKLLGRLGAWPTPDPPRQAHGRLASGLLLAVPAAGCYLLPAVCLPCLPDRGTKSLDVSPPCLQAPGTLMALYGGANEGGNIGGHLPPKHSGVVPLPAVAAVAGEPGGRGVRSAPQIAGKL